MWQEKVVLGHEPGSFEYGFVEFSAVGEDCSAAAVSLESPCNRIEERGFSTPGGTKDGQDFSWECHACDSMQDSLFLD